MEKWSCCFLTALKRLEVDLLSQKMIFVFCRFFENDIVTQTKGTRQHDYSELDNKPENKYAGENVFQMFHRFCQALLRDPQCIGSSFPTAFII